MTSKAFANIASKAYELAEQVKPVNAKSAADPYWDSRQLIVYHLRTAAGEAQRIAVAMKQAEGGK